MVKFRMRLMFYSTLCLPCQWLFCLPCQWLLPIYSVQPANFTAKHTTINEVTRWNDFERIFAHFMGVLQTTSMRCFLHNYHFSWDFGVTIQQLWQLRNPMILSSTLPDGTFQIHLTRKGPHNVFGWIPINTDLSESSSTVALQGCHWRQDAAEGATWSWPEVVVDLSSPLLGGLCCPGRGFCYWVGSWSCFSGETDFNCQLKNIECLDVDFAFRSFFVALELPPRYQVFPMVPRIIHKNASVPKVFKGWTKVLII